MKKATIYLFTSQTCPHCPAAKKDLEQLKEQRDDIETELLDVHSAKGQKLGREFGLKSVPTFVIQGPSLDQGIAAVGNQGVDKLNQFADAAVGKGDLNKEKTGWRKFLSKIGIDIN